jgi:hypothetical protein
MLAQQAIVSLGSSSISPGGQANLAVTLAANGGPTPAGLQWTMTYSQADIVGFNAVVNSAASAAGKTISCSSAPGATTCLLSGTNAMSISDGVVATATFSSASGTTATTVPVQVTASTVDITGTGAAATGVGGTISIHQSTSPTLTGFSCSPATVVTPGSSTCIMTLSGPAPTGGLGITLVTNNAAVTMPGSVSVASGASNASFAVNVAAVATSQSAVLRATTASASLAFSLGLSVPAQYSISGNTGSTGGTTVTLGGALSATTTSDASGNYLFNGVRNGTYTVSANRSGYAFTPATFSVSVNGASISGINFTATPIVTSTFTISGTLAPASLAVGASITLSGAASRITSVDSLGNYSFTGLVNGTYAVTPAGPTTFTPSNRSVTVSGTSQSNINFTANQNAQIQIDTIISHDQATPVSRVTVPSISTNAGSELLVAFVATDYSGGPNATVTSLSGGGLTWNLVVRSNGQSGTSEIWRAFAKTRLANVSVTARLSQSVVSAMTVVSLRGVNTSGANGSGAIGAIGSANDSSGAPTVSMITRSKNSWVLAVGNDFDNAIARIPVAGQSKLHEYLAPVGDTYWVQKLDSPTSAGGSQVTVSDVSPTSDRFNLSAVEILPAGAALTPVLSTMGVGGLSRVSNGSAAAANVIPAFQGGIR